MENKYEKWEPTPLKEWAEQNYLNLTDEQLVKLESHLREISTHNNIKDGEKNWKEYLGEISVQGIIEDENGEEHVLFDLSKNDVDGFTYWSFAVKGERNWKECLNELLKNNKNGVDIK